MSWLEIAGRLALLAFAVIVAVLLFAQAARTYRGGTRTGSSVDRSMADSRPRTHPAPGFSGTGRLDRFIAEYVGNESLDGFDASSGLARFHERRGEGETRALFDLIIVEMQRRNVPPGERETFLEDLRRTIREEERLRAIGSKGRERERRFLETQRWALAERFHTIVEDPPPEIVARIKLGFDPVPGALRLGHDVDR